MAPQKIYYPSRPDIELFRGDCVSYILSNPFNVPDNKKVLLDPANGESWSFGDVKQRTRSLAHGLRELGVKPKDIVLFFSPNSIDYAITCYAIIGCGATVSPANSALNATELAAQLETSGAQYLIVHSSLRPVAQAALKTATSVRKLVIADGRQAVDGIPTARMMASGCLATELISIASEEATSRLAFLCFSSGTTGKAKGVMTTHQNMTSNMQQWKAHAPELWHGGDTSVGFLPFSHIYALQYYVCTSMWVGNLVVVMPRFDLPGFLGYVQEYRPEELVVVPPIILLLARHPLVAKYDLSSVKRILSAAAPLSPELRVALEKRLKDLYGSNVFAYQCFGATETSPLMSGVGPGRWDKLSTVGDIVPNTRARLVDTETLEDVEQNPNGNSKPGELWAGGPNIAIGYYNNPAATKETFFTESNGLQWYRTGDIAVIDPDGFITIVDRIKEMIKYKGLQVVPSELEGKLIDHPMVADACVIGVWYDDQATELPVGFIVLNADAQKSNDVHKIKEDVHKFINERVANHKRLRGGLVIVDAIPKSPTGKILRREVKDKFAKKLQAQPKL